MDLVTRTRAATDERLMIIGLTERGAAMQTEAAHVAVDLCAATGLAVADQLELVRTLRQLTSELDASTRSVLAAEA